MNLVESYLRLNGYLTLSEFEVQRRESDGTYKTVTDVDIMAVRMPGEVHGDHDDCDMLLLDDPVLELRPDLIDVIIGEVKQGHAELNPGIKDHTVLHTVLQRAAWLYGDELTSVIESLQRHEIADTAAPGGHVRVRTRLVAFGRADASGLHTVQISHVVGTMLRFFEEHAAAFKPVQFRDPAPAFLRLLLKTGFDVTRP